MRIAFCSHSTRAYGATRSLEILIGLLREAGHETAVILPGPGHAQGLLAQQGAQVGRGAIMT